MDAMKSALKYINQIHIYKTNALPAKKSMAKPDAHVRPCFQHAVADLEFFLYSVFIRKRVAEPAKPDARELV